MLEGVKKTDVVNVFNVNHLPVIANAVIGISVLCAAELLFQSCPQLIDPWVGRTIVAASIGAASFAFFRFCGKVTEAPCPKKSLEIVPPIPNFPPPPNYSAPPSPCEFPTSLPPPIPKEYIPYQKIKNLQKLLEVEAGIDSLEIDVFSIHLDHHQEILKWLESITNSSSTSSAFSGFDPWNHSRKLVAQHALALLKLAVENDRFFQESFMPLIKESNGFFMNSNHVLYCFNDMVRAMDSCNCVAAASLSELNLQLYGKLVKLVAEKSVPEQDKVFQYVRELEVKAVEHALYQQLGIKTLLSPYCVKQITSELVAEVKQKSRENLSKMLDYLPQGLKGACNRFNDELDEMKSDKNMYFIHEMIKVACEKQSELEALSKGLQSKLASPDLVELSKEDHQIFAENLMKAFTKEQRIVIGEFETAIREIVRRFEEVLP